MKFICQYNIGKSLTNGGRIMKRSLQLFIVLAVSFMLVAVALADSSTMKLQVGDEAYVCNCGAGCPCQTMSQKTGKCVCDNDLVKAKVVKLDKDVAQMQAAGWDKPRAFHTVGKYACDCGPSCNCGTISQKPGKCVCGHQMKEVK
jgi:hypothetical protein